MDTQQSSIIIAREFIAAIIASGFPLRKAFLFGSYARNEQRKDSDIDLALIADEFTGVGFFDLKHFVNIKISKQQYTPIEAHTFNTDYFSSGDPFIREIIKTGIPLM
jgi:predicted nucleotidyltransferase